MTFQYSSIIDADAALENIENPTWRFLDCTFDLFDSQLGQQHYLAGHIPGAVFVDVNQSLSSTQTPDSGRHPLPEASVLAKQFSQWGIDSNTQVVVYDNEASGGAARLWWSLRWLGHKNVAVLNGGVKYWKKLGYPLATNSVEVEPKSFHIDQQEKMLVKVNELLLSDKNQYLVDARSPERYRGEQEPIDTVAGHIPGAANYFNMNNFDVSGRYKTAETLKYQLIGAIKDVPPTNVVHYCGSGVSACQNILAMEYAGLEGSKLYAGSWSEWIKDQKRLIGTSKPKI